VLIPRKQAVFVCHPPWADPADSGQSPATSSPQLLSRRERREVSAKSLSSHTDSKFQLTLVILLPAWPQLCALLLEGRTKIVGRACGNSCPITWI
jgi:hypothetical protein